MSHLPMTLVGESTTDAEQPLTLIYDSKEASNSDLASYYERAEERLIEISHKNLKVKKILLNTYSTKYESKLTSLACYALKSQVQELDLLYLFHYSPGGETVLDDSFFINSHLTSLNLSCNFRHPTHDISWGNLNSLSLSKLFLTEDLFQKILSGCPLLHTLKLHNCNGDVWRLHISSNTLKTFEISGNEQFRRGLTCVMLTAPYITSLTFKGSPVLSQLDLVDVSSLVEANLDYCTDEDQDDTPEDLTPDEEQAMIYRHVSFLRGYAGASGVEPTLGKRCAKVQSAVDANGFRQKDYYDEYLEDLADTMGI